VDDNKETMQKRLKIFVDFSVPVVKYYESMGKVHKVSSLSTLFMTSTFYVSILCVTKLLGRGLVTISVVAIG